MFKEDLTENATSTELAECKLASAPNETLRTDLMPPRRELITVRRITQVHRDRRSHHKPPAHENTPSPVTQAGGVSHLQLDRLDFGDEPSGVVTQVRGDHVDHGVTEAADVQDVSTLPCGQPVSPRDLHPGLAEANLPFIQSASCDRCTRQG